jgi:glycosyltransferase involved in cell wall biosynthesis
MPGTLTRLNRVRSSAGSLRLASRNGRALGPLRGRPVALAGSDASPHVTGFPNFTTALHDLLLARAGRVSRPLQAPSKDVPELVVAVLPGPGAAGAAAELADRHGVPLLVVLQGETLPLTEDAGTSGARLAARLETRALRRADRWAVTSESARRRLLRLGIDETRIDRLPYWAAPVRTGQQVEADRATARRALGLPSGFLVVCPVGADTSGLLAVITAAHRFAARRSDVQFVLVGRGPRLRALAASAADALNVTIAELDDHEYPAALFAADLLLLTETADQPDGATAGRLAAGMAAGRPTIAALAEAGRSVAAAAQAKGALRVIPADRPEQLAATIDELRNDPAGLNEMATGARNFTRAQLSPETATATFEQIVTRTLSRPAGSSWWGWTR